ncbi:MAG: hypothetical protein IKL59_02795 [Clostridia bacterium]|nr:hypothetical protein [Clostridia bacterium]MBR6680167.1 hypothetical protein [Clostridia bacterium]
MNKFKLDESKIKVDLRQHADYVFDILENYLFYIIFSLFLIGIIVAVIFKNAWMLLILPAAPMVCQLCIFTAWLIRRHNIKKGNFSIHTGVFKKNKTKEIFFSLDRFHWFTVEECLDHYYFMYFDLGRWLIPGKRLYDWSDESRMEINSIRFSTEVGDEFYIVTYGKSKKIGYVYNKKIFTIVEDHRNECDH